YKVYRNVKDYGAVGDGKTDDTAAINAAIADGNRCGNGCGTSSVKGALVYFPSGTYLVSSSLYSLYNTQLVGDPGSWPVLLVAPSFAGAGVITSDVYIGDNIEWYKSQSNFYRQVRNFLIDMSQCQTSGVWGVHWQVGQATSLQNLFFHMTDSSTSTQIGIFAEDGSGGFMSDLFFYGGNTGITCGNQQFTVRDLSFFGTWRAVSMLWDWGWTWKGLNVLDATFGIWFQSSNVGGSMYVLDSSFENVVTAFFITTPTAGVHQEVLLNIDNFAMKNVATGVLTSNFTVALAGGTRTVAGWTYGQIYDAKTPNGRWVTGEESALHPVTPSLTTSSGSYFTFSKPQYSGTDANTQWVTAQLVAKGDGVTDDTASLAFLFSVALQYGYYVFFPAGSYIITDTLRIPTGVNVAGACWAQIVATGANFADVNNPRVAVQVGAPNDVGSVQIQDLLVTVKGNTAGAILMEWNVKQSSQGSAAMWDTHFRIGGAKGTSLTATDCPTLTGKINPKCIAASMTLHVTKSSSAYLENVWAWTADHDLDTTSETQVDIYTARGVLIESQGPVWMVGTASEHAALYQYALDGAKDVWMGMIQTESPYYYPAPVAPQPFNTTGQFPGDPSFASCQDTGCKAAWALTLNSSSNVQITGAGLYSWYSNNYSQNCVDTQNCQDSLVTTQNSGDVYLLNLYTVGAINMVVPDPAVSLPTIKAASNTFQNAHPFVAGVSRWQYTH
ncbi:pectin lyase-like protein, partial [Thozetella sp. PMI_491]